MESVIRKLADFNLSVQQFGVEEESDLNWDHIASEPPRLVIN